MTAWLLVINMSMMTGDTVVIPGIASLDECSRLAEEELWPKGFRHGKYPPLYKCIEYRIAK